MLLSPELILLFTGLVVLIVDFVWREKVPEDVSAEAEDEALAKVTAGGKKTTWIPALRRRTNRTVLANRRRVFPPSLVATKSAACWAKADSAVSISALIPN